MFALKRLGEHPISKQQNQHKLSQWITPHITCWFGPTAYLHFYWPIIFPSLRSLSGSALLSNRRSLSHSLIERLSGDYGEVRNKVVSRNHKHKPFHSRCSGIIFPPQQLFIIPSWSPEKRLSFLCEYFRLGVWSSSYRQGNGKESNFTSRLSLHSLASLMCHDAAMQTFNNPRAPKKQSAWMCTPSIQ